jgi:uncharacterized protein
MNFTGIALFVLWSAFAFRVLAQLLQYLSPVPFLPPFAHWQSGVLPYPALLACQVVLLGLLFRVAARIARGHVVPLKEMGRRMLILGTVYASAMVIRYVLHMLRLPDDRWLGGCIPIFFHLVLASFLMVAGRYHYRRGASGPAPSLRSIQIWRGACGLMATGMAFFIAYQVWLIKNA